MKRGRGQGRKQEEGANEGGGRARETETETERIFFNWRRKHRVNEGAVGTGEMASISTNRGLAVLHDVMAYARDLHARLLAVERFRFPLASM